jgi:hypothetical protein
LQNAHAIPSENQNPLRTICLHLTGHPGSHLSFPPDRPRVSTSPQRVRKKARMSAPRGKSLELPGVCAQETADGVARDPLANLKRLEESRPGFHWRSHRE